MCNRPGLFQPARSFVLLAMMLAVAACAGPPAAPTPTAPATLAPSPDAPVRPTPTALPADTPTPAAPTADPLPTPDPTPPAAAGPPLPAPLYYLDGGQIWRLERDGLNRRQISFEATPIEAFEIAAQTDTLVYVIEDAGESVLVALDAGGRSELFFGAVSQPQISPDGAEILFRLDEATPGLIIGQDSAPTGVWITWRTGGRPGLVRADDPQPANLTPDQEVYVYTPTAWSPDGERLLISGFNLALAGFPGGKAVALNRADQREVAFASCCEREEWSVDGAAITVAGGGPGPDVRYGLWRIDPATGAETALFPDQAATVPLVTAAQQLGDGNIYAFVEMGANITFDYPFQPAMYRIAPDGALTQLRPETFTVQEALWADDASGAVIASGAALLGWVPTDGGPALDLPAAGSNLRWGSPTAPSAAAACANFAPLAWQAPEMRRPAAAVADLQRRLLALGYAAGSADGLFGDATRAAVTDLQRFGGLPPTGEVDCATWQLLFGPGAPPALRGETRRLGSGARACNSHPG